MDGPTYRPLDILICEDHPVSKIVMEKLCEKLRCRTITATNGPQAAGYAGGNIQFDIIFTEYKLPLINGVDLARMIRDTKSANTLTPIVCITGYLKDLPDEHQFDMLMLKPPTAEKLTEVLIKHCFWKPPPDDYKLPMPHKSHVAVPAEQLEGSPSSVASTNPISMPGSSVKGSSREDSISSGGFFSDLESLKADEIPLTISRAATDDWKSGLGISNDIADSTYARLVQTESAPPVVQTDDHTKQLDRNQPSSEAIRTKRESLEKNRVGTVGAEEGDDEDEELGLLSARQKSPVTKSARTGSKLGYEMLRTNSRGSVISMNEERAAEAESLRKSLEILENRMGELRIPENDTAILGSVQPRKSMRSQASSSTTEMQPGPLSLPAHGHITPPTKFPLAPGNDSKDIIMDDEPTPMPNKVIDFGDQPTPRAQSENGSTSQE